MCLFGLRSHWHAAKALFLTDFAVDSRMTLSPVPLVSVWFEMNEDVAEHRKLLQ